MLFTLAVVIIEATSAGSCVRKGSRASAMAIVYYHKSRIVTLMMFLIGCGVIFSLAFTRSERVKPAKRAVLFSIRNKSSVSTDETLADVRRHLNSSTAKSSANKSDSVEALAKETLNEKPIAISADDIALDVPDALLDIEKDQETMNVPQLSPQMLEQLLQNDEDANNVDSQHIDLDVPAAKEQQSVNKVPKVAKGKSQLKAVNQKSDAQAASRHLEEIPAGNKNSTQVDVVIPAADAEKVGVSAVKISPSAGAAAANNSAAVHL